MKLAIIYEVNSLKKEMFSINLKNTLIKSKKENIVIDIYKSSDVISGKYDVYVLVLHSINELKNCQKKIKEKNKVIVLTDNTNAGFIISCVDYTKNLCYLKVEISTIFSKIHSVYQNTKNSNNKKIM